MLRQTKQSFLISLNILFHYLLSFNFLTLSLSHSPQNPLCLQTSTPMQKLYRNYSVFNFTILQFYNFTILQFYNFTILQFYNFIILQFHLLYYHQQHTVPIYNLIVGRNNWLNLVNEASIALALASSAPVFKPLFLLCILVTQFNY